MNTLKNCSRSLHEEENLMSHYVQQGSFTLPKLNQDTITVLSDVLGDGRLLRVMEMPFK